VGEKKKITYLKVGIVLWRRLIQDSSVGVGMCGSSEGNLQEMVLAVYLSFANNGNGTNCEVLPIASSVLCQSQLLLQAREINSEHKGTLPSPTSVQVQIHRIHNVSEFKPTF